MFSSRLNFFGYLFKEQSSRDPICRMELQEWPRNLWRFGCHIFLSSNKITSEIQRSETFMRTGAKVLLYGKEDNGRNNHHESDLWCYLAERTWILLQLIIYSPPRAPNMGLSSMHKCPFASLPASKNSATLTLCRYLYRYIHSGQKHTWTHVYHLF